MSEATHPQPRVDYFFDEVTSTFSYVVSCPQTGHCGIVDPVLDLDYASGTITTGSADELIQFVRDNGLTVTRILETHVHADHLTAAPYLQSILGGEIVIGADITVVQRVFAEIFNEDDGFRVDGSQFDCLVEDGEEFAIGSLCCTAMHVPGHTPACMAYLIGDALFVGDTLFMPDAGTARCDFPGGDARTLFRSVRRLLELPDQTRVFVCHDYQPDGRELLFESTVATQKAHNIHVATGISEDDFVAMREARDKTLAMPTLILPSLQVNMRAGHMPPLDDDQRLFLKVPINVFGGAALSTLVSTS